MSPGLRVLNRELVELEESVRPGASLVQDIRSVRPRLVQMTRQELSGAFTRLGQHISGVTSSTGDLLLVEADNPDPLEDERIKAIIEAARLDVWKLQHLKPILEKAWRRSSQMTQDRLEKHGITATLRDKVAAEMLEQGGTRIGLVDLDQATKEALLKVLEVAKELDVSARDMGKLIEHYVPAGRFTQAGPSYRARLIANTETLESQRHSELAVYRSSPVVEKVMAFDGVEHDETCAERNGQVFTIEEAEQENANTHPNCVLAWAPV